MDEKKERWEYELEEILRAGKVSGEEPGNTALADEEVLEISPDLKTWDEALDYLREVITAAMRGHAGKKEFLLGENLLTAIAENPLIVHSICMHLGRTVSFNLDERKLVVWH